MHINVRVFVGGVGAGGWGGGESCMHVCARVCVCLCVCVKKGMLVRKEKRSVKYLSGVCGHPIIVKRSISQRTRHEIHLSVRVLVLLLAS